jgi:hypothetical protein
MTLRTRGSAALDKAQRRLATLKAIDDSLDLGHGLTIEHLHPNDCQYSCRH